MSTALRPSLLRLAVATVLVAAPVASFASGFALLEQSASRLGTAFAGTAAAADDATTVFYNPAGLSRLTRAEFTVVASGVDIGSEFDNRSSVAALGQPLGGEGGNAGGWNAVPAAYFALPINEQLAFGFGVNAPFGLELEYDNAWMGRFQARKSEIQTYNFNPSLSWKVNDFVSLGIGANLQHVQAELTNAVNYTAVVAQGLQQLVAAGQVPAAAVPGLIAANAGLEGAAVVRGDDTQWGYNVGVLFQWPSGTRLGFAYRSSIDYHIEGAARFTAPTPTNPTGAAIVAAASAGALATTPASVDLELPDIATASLVQPLGPKTDLLVDVAWTGWSSVRELAVVRNSGAVLSVTPERWDDTWRYALGVSHQLNEQWKLRAGLAIDGTPVPSATRTARLPDAQRKWLALGARWSASEAFDVDVGLAHLFSKDVTVDQDDGNALANGVINGRQSSDVNILSAQVAYRF
jgi:long-chain fatty acid transport protein